MNDIERIDRELDRIRWYVARLANALSPGLSPERIALALKTGDASTDALTGEESA